MLKALFGGGNAVYDDDDHNGLRRRSQDEDGGAVAYSVTEARELQELLQGVLRVDLDSAERRQQAYSLRELFVSVRDSALARPYAEYVTKRIGDVSIALNDQENEEIAQILLELLASSAEKVSVATSVILETPDVIVMLLEVATNARFVWVRVSAIQSLQALAISAPKETVDHLLSIPSALETLVGFLSDAEIDVRNEMIILLQKLTEVSEQVRLFLVFCDGLNALLKIATDEKDTLVASDCLAICVNSLRNNPVGQKQFIETQEFLNTISALLLFDPELQDPTPSILRVGKCVELIRIICQGRIESKEPLATENGSQERDEKRISNLKNAQTKLGSTPQLMDRLFIVASDPAACIEESTRRDAVCALGDLVAHHARNGTRLERVAGFSFLVSAALTSTRWADAKCAAYAWLCAVDGPEGEQRAIALIGHAIAPLPQTIAEEEDENKVDDAVTLIAQALLRSVESIVVLRDEVYVDPVRVSERRTTMWRASKLWEMLLVSPSAKELAMKVTVDGSLLIDLLCECVRSLLIEKDETEGVKDLTNDTCAGLIKLLSIWVMDDRESANHVLSLPSNLLFFEPLPTKIEKIRGLGALLAACCLVSTWDTKEKTVAFGLIENKMGITPFFQFLSKLAEIANKENSLGRLVNWSSDDCTYIVFDSKFVHFITKIVSQANPLLVKGSSSSSMTILQTNSVDVSAGQGSSIQMNGAESSHNSLDISSLATKFHKMEQDYAQLLIVLAHQEIDRQSLLQTIEDLGGKDSLDKALARSASILKVAFAALDAKQ